ncbi:hypothetical protein NLJ89_g65 [Agrocybe chaxingu]|uniref:Uncharacterized protein n=1 Tax=Agrocybe chaxingu TaxID=84603 RepID=A0A9W8TGW9_9AGAR|nr:hypothetical protein NLJ89_g65 [Agrocybe chaxingu]
MSHQQPRLQQMLLVLSAQSRHLPVTFSLTTPTPQPTAGEAAIRDLLRLVRSPRPQADPNTKFKNSPAFQTRTPTFLSGGLPRDRRGRVAGKGKNIPELRGLAQGEEEQFGDDTPRLGPSSYIVEAEREREREFLEALRSPDIEPPTREGSGGWGLGAGHEENNKAEEEEDDALDWDQAQAVVERMVGMNTNAHPEPRRRMT